MARVNLTTGRIRNFKCSPTKSQSFLWDSAVSGLGIRATPKNKTFIFQSRLAGGGNAFRMSVGPVDGLNIDEARRIASGYVAIVSDGKDPRIVRQENIDEHAIKRERAIRREFTLADVWPIYIDANKHRWSERHLIDHYRYSQKGGEQAKRGKNKIVPGPLWPLMNKRLSDLTPETVKTWATSESATRATQCRNAFGALRACLNWCADHPIYKGLVNPDACSSRVKRASIPPKKTKKDCLQKEQLKAWFSAMRQIDNPVISGYLQSLLLTGARREELGRLQWIDIDFKWKSLTIRDKVDGERTIPLTPYVASLLGSLPRRNEWVFSSPAAKSGWLQEPRHPHNRALLKAGIEGLTLHGLRRSFSTLSEWVEVPAGVVAQIMGHKPSATAEKHYIVRPLDLLRMWHIKVEAWILEQAGIEQPTEEAILLRAVKK